MCKSVTVVALLVVWIYYDLHIENIEEIKMKDCKPNYLKDKEGTEYRELRSAEITKVGELFKEGVLRIKRSEGVFDKPIGSESVGDGFLNRCLFVAFDGED